MVDHPVSNCGSTPCPVSLAGRGYSQHDRRRMGAHVLAHSGVVLLGDVAVICGRTGTSLAVHSPTLRALLTVLALRVGQLIGRDELMQAVWPSPRSSTRNSLYTYMSRLRMTFLDPVTGETPVTSNATGYRLDLPADAVDVHRFRDRSGAALASSAALPRPAAIEAHDHALETWSGEPFPGTRSGYLETQRALLTEEWLQVNESRSELLLRDGRASQALAPLRGLVGAHPLRESLVVLLMRCHAQLGNRAEALAVCERLRRGLADELGVDPGAACQHEFHRLIATPEWPGTAPLTQLR